MMKLYSKYIFLFFLSISSILVSSCQDKEDFIIPDSNEVVFRVEASDVPQTRMSGDDEKRLDTTKPIYVLAFINDGGTKTFAYKANATYVSDAAGVYSYKVRVQFRDKPQFFVFLANVPSSTIAGIPFTTLSGQSYDDVLDQLLMQRSDLEANLIPMSGITPSAGITINESTAANTPLTSTPTKLLRMMAKIDIINTNGNTGGTNRNNFELTEVSLCNRPESGYLAYQGENLVSGTGYYRMTKPYPWAKKIDLSGDDIYYTKVNGDFTDDTSKKEILKSTIYTFEKPAPTAQDVADGNTTYLILKGNRAGTPKEYRVYIPSFPNIEKNQLNLGIATVGSYGPIVRNYHYTITIVQVADKDLLFHCTATDWTDVDSPTYLDKDYRFSLSEKEIMLSSLPEAGLLDYSNTVDFVSDYRWNCHIYNNEDMKDEHEIKNWDDLPFSISGFSADTQYDSLYAPMPRTAGIGEPLTFTTTKMNGSETGVRKYYVKFNAYSTDGQGVQVDPYLRMTMKLTVSQNTFYRGPANCYMADHSKPRVFAIPLSQVFNAMDEFLGSDWMTDPNKVKAQIYWSDVPKYSSNGEITGGVFESDNGVVEKWRYCTDWATTPLQDRYIFIYPGHHRGNVGMILYEDNGDDKYTPGEKIYWSWHIWNIDYHPYSYDSYSADDSWLQRNLGSVLDPGDLSNVGFFYQWGRKDPFPALSSWDVSTGTGKKAADRIFFYENSGGAFLKDTGATDLIASVKNPMTGYFSWAPQNGYWDESKKSVFDPCPPKYKVPKIADWETTGWRTDSIGNIHHEYRLGQYNSTYGGYYPATGYGLDQSAGEVNDYVTDSKKAGYYWSATVPDATNAQILRFYDGVDANNYFAGAVIKIDESKPRKLGLNVRCIKE